MSSEHAWALVEHVMRKYFPVENQHFRANFFSSCEMIPPQNLETQSTPEASSGITKCITDLGLKNIYAENKCQTFEKYQF